MFLKYLNTINIDNYNTHKQNIFGVLQFFKNIEVSRTKTLKTTDIWNNYIVNVIFTCLLNKCGKPELFFCLKNQKKSISISFFLSNVFII